MTNDHLPANEHDLKLIPKGKLYVGFRYYDRAANHSRKVLSVPKFSSDKAMRDYIRDVWLPSQRVAVAGHNAPTVLEIFDAWCSDKKSARNGKDTNAHAHRKVFERYWCTRPVTDITTASLDDFQQWLANRGKLDGTGYAANTTNTIMGHLSGAMTAATKMQRLPASFLPAKFPDPLVTEDACYYMTLETVNRLRRICIDILEADQTPHHLRDTFDMDWRYALWCLLALETAGRGHAVQALSWDRIRLKQREVILQRPDKKPNRKKVNAVAKIAPWLVPILTKEWGKRGTNHYVMGRVVDTHHSIATFLAKYGIMSVNRELPDRPTQRHDFRRTWASHAISAGVMLGKIAKQLGDREETVARYYARFFDDLTDHTDNLLANMWVIPSETPGEDDSGTGGTATP
jgi:integrase